MKRLLLALVANGLIGGAVFWFLTAPQKLDESMFAAIDGHEPDLGNGETLFWAGGCASCHAAPKVSGDAKKVLSGGLVLTTEFGDFAVPNISPSREHGLGNWSFEDFSNAMKKGVSPEGRHYYPAFPYASYAHMTIEDLSDLFAFLKQLPVSEEADKPSDIAFPFNVRRGLGLWKKLYLNDKSVISDAALGDDEQLLRGRYLVEGPGHCGECHTPRSLAGGMQRSNWLQGAPSPEGEGRIPGITNGPDNLESWSESDIAYMLETGFTPDFDSVGSSMADVAANYAFVPASDREAIAAYLKIIQP
ncbi:cytochrome c [Ahrensia kielensis]|uniref:cytochrome c n=1 Tax=Ahrensia kielensis TaxID=76980 RepID=UPI00038216FB|nr:cytochrome c [Ahrensia kielensis]